MKTALKVLAVVCSVALIGGYVWHAQQSAGQIRAFKDTQSSVFGAHERNSSAIRELNSEVEEFEGFIN